MEGFLKLIGIEAQGFQVKASNDPDNIPIADLLNNGVDGKVVEYIKRTVPREEWLLISVWDGEKRNINEGEGVTLVDLHQDTEESPKLVYFPHNLGVWKNIPHPTSPCGVLAWTKKVLEKEVQQWCQKTSGNTPPVCSDLEPVPNCNQ